MEFIYLFDHMNSLELLDCFADCVWDSKWEEIVKMIGGELKGRGLCNLQLRIACQSVVTVEGLGLIGGSCSQVYARGKLNHLVATCMRIRFCGYKAYSFPFRLLPFVLGLTGAEILEE